MARHLHNVTSWLRRKLTAALMNAPVCMFVFLSGRGCNHRWILSHGHSCELYIHFSLCPNLCPLAPSSLLLLHSLFTTKKEKKIKRSTHLEQDTHVHKNSKGDKSLLQFLFIYLLFALSSNIALEVMRNKHKYQ